MKKLIIKIIFGLLIAAFVGCSSDYFDVNTPTNAANVDQLEMSDFLAPAIFHTVTAQYFAERTLGNYTQNFTGQGGTAAGATSISSTWSQSYLFALPNLNTLLGKAEANNATHFAAVAKILIAVNLGLLTDSYGDIPYSKASLGAENLQPEFDSQQNIYASIDTLLAIAISSLEATDTSGFTLGNGDIIYGGNTDKWLRAAYTLRARYQLHLAKKNGTSAATSALASIANGFTSNSDDLQMSYSDAKINPWYSRQILAANTGNVHDVIGDQLISYMNGTSYPYTTIALDPRTSIFAKNNDGAGTDWKGYVSGGQGVSSDGTSANTSFADGGFYTNIAAPIVIVSYAEAQFIKAEAAFLANGGSTTSTGSNATAYTAYLAGIQASMDKVGVSGTNSAAYLADTSIDLGLANLRLEHIMKEKYIADFLNPETFVDLRRYDFSPNVFKDLTLPVDNATGEFPGQWIVRAQYPSIEETRNPDNVNAHKKSPTVPVWWAE